MGQKNKLCKRCNKTKDINEFHKSSKTKDGIYRYCKECKNLEGRLYAQKYPERVKEKAKRDWQKNKEKYKLYVNNNREKFRTKSRNYMREALKCPKFRLIFNNIQRIVKFHKIRKKYDINFKTSWDEKIFGCDKDTFIKHVESKFQPGMTWENYGPKGWHTDHIYPLSIAYKESLERFIQVCHYTNIQPLWAVDNLKKASSIGYIKEIK
jgi:hypothetical protein